ncbi:hypothetical protein AAFF_G00296820 [Aldrovandia affinis]|uniref:Uncharacterized protein n=1 Tax=Aldrovandia affinis TaxID=143900 RepID=A0AAD7WRI6_9TELE|nr:hypothetical protein AAFF_G00296820 [Aldrovandia affinis]
MRDSSYRVLGIEAGTAQLQATSLEALNYVLREVSTNGLFPFQSRRLRLKSLHVREVETAPGRPEPAVERVLKNQSILPVPSQMHGADERASLVAARLICKANADPLRRRGAFGHLAFSCSRPRRETARGYHKQT